MVTLTLSCLISAPAHAEDEAKKNVESAQKKITLPRPKLKLTDAEVQNLPPESAKKVMLDALLEMSHEYEKDLMSQLDMDIIESPYSDRAMKRGISFMLGRKTSAEMVPSLITPLVFKMLDGVASRYQATRNVRQARFQSQIGSFIDPLKTRLDLLQERLDKLDASSAAATAAVSASVKKGPPPIIESFKNPAIIILLVLQVLVALFVVIKLN